MKNDVDAEEELLLVVLLLVLEINADAVAVLDQLDLDGPQLAHLVALDEDFVDVDRLENFFLDRQPDRFFVLATHWMEFPLFHQLGPVLLPDLAPLDKNCSPDSALLLHHLVQQELHLLLLRQLVPDLEYY